MSPIRPANSGTDTIKSMRSRLIISLISIAIILGLGAVISLVEYRRVAGKLEDIAGNTKAINDLRASITNLENYNLNILSCVGEESTEHLPVFDRDAFASSIYAIAKDPANRMSSQAADSVIYLLDAYLALASELESVIVADFVDSRMWYFETLKPSHDRLLYYLAGQSAELTIVLNDASSAFDNGLYRAIVPEIIAVAVTVLLFLVLGFFMIRTYINPLYRMLDALNAYRSNDKKYNYRFDGDDQLAALNDGISEIAEENRQLRSRIRTLRRDSYGDKNEE